MRDAGHCVQELIPAVMQVAWLANRVHPEVAHPGQLGIRGVAAVFDSEPGIGGLPGIAGAGEGVQDDPDRCVTLGVYTDLPAREMRLLYCLRELGRIPKQDS